MRNIDKLLSFLLLFFMLSVMTFSIENMFIVLEKQITSQTLDISFKATDHNNHSGQWVLALVLLLVIPWYHKFYTWRASLNDKIFTNLWVVGLLSMLVIYLGEFTVGCIFNLGLHMDFWDYSNQKLHPIHLLGQISATFIPTWFISGLLSFIIYKVIFAYDMEIAKVLRTSVTNLFKGLFLKKGNVLELDKDFFNIKADYLDKLDPKS